MSYCLGGSISYQGGTRGPVTGATWAVFARILSHGRHGQKFRTWMSRWKKLVAHCNRPERGESKVRQASTRKNQAKWEAVTDGLRKVRCGGLREGYYAERAGRVISLLAINQREKRSSGRLRSLREGNEKGEPHRGN